MTSRALPAPRLRLGFAMALLALAWALGAQAQAAPSEPVREPAREMGRPAASASPDPLLEQRVLQVAEELRCLVCQNETIAASQAELAQDLRAQIREQLRAGRDAAQIRDYMVARYGDFILYRPPWRASTVLLWLGPFALLLLALVVMRSLLRPREGSDADAVTAPAARAGTSDAIAAGHNAAATDDELRGLALLQGREIAPAHATARPAPTGAAQQP